MGVLMADRDIHHNFVVSNYGGFKGVDNDDGSSYYQIHHNIMVNGWMHKSNYGGHAKATYGNLGAFVSYGMRMNAPQVPSQVDGFYNNTCVFMNGADRVYAEVSEDSADCPKGQDCYQRIGNNTVYTDSSVVPTVGFPPGKSHDKYITIDKWLKLGHDQGTTWNQTLPSSAQIADWGRALLGMKKA